MPPVETRLRVRYAETYQLGVVYYANYLVWMELGRVEYCRAAGIRYRDMEQDDGILLAVTEASCRYASPARYDEEVIVRTWLKKVRESVIIFNYELARANNGMLLAEGETIHIVTDSKMQVASLPTKYLTVFRTAARK